MKYTARTLFNGAEPVQIGDYVFVSPRRLSCAQIKKHIRTLSQEPWFSELVGCGTEVLTGNDLPWYSIASRLELAHHHTGMTDGQEPEWTRLLPRALARELRTKLALGDGFDQRFIVPVFPGTGFGYMVLDDGLTAETINTFRLFRLAGIRQLAFLHDPDVRAAGAHSVTIFFSHTRLCHSLDTTAIGTLLVENNRRRLTERDIAHLLTATTSHDALTPAGGDTVKLIDPEVFDEDTHYPEIFNSDRWPSLKAAYKLDERFLHDIILGKGVCGTLLNIADKCAYTARDMDAYCSRGKMDWPHLYRGDYSLLREHSAKHPLIVSMWGSVQVTRGGEVVICDADALSRFLEVRALLFRGLYYKAESRFIEHLCANVLVKYLYQTGKITREDLLREGDWWLEDRIDELVGVPYFMRTLGDLENANVSSFGTFAEARAHERKMRQRKGTLTLIDEFRAPTNSAVKSFLVKRGRSVMPFTHARPDCARNIDALLREPKPFRVYTLDLKNLRLDPELVLQIKRSVST